MVRVCVAHLRAGQRNTGVAWKQLPPACGVLHRWPCLGLTIICSPWWRVQSTQKKKGKHLDWEWWVPCSAAWSSVSHPRQYKFGHFWLKSDVHLCPVHLIWKCRVSDQTAFMLYLHFVSHVCFFSLIWGYLILVTVCDQRPQPFLVWEPGILRLLWPLLRAFEIEWADLQGQGLGQHDSSRLLESCKVKDLILISSAQAHGGLSRISKTLGT